MSPSCWRWSLLAEVGPGDSPGPSASAGEFLVFSGQIPRTGSHRGILGLRVRMGPSTDHDIYSFPGIADDRFVTNGICGVFGYILKKG